MQPEEAYAGPGRLRLLLAPDLDAPAVARRALRSLPLGEHADDVLLLASELVTSAVVHAESDAPIELTAASEAGRTRVEVRDHGDAFSSGSAAGGYGLDILEAASERWGIEEDRVTCVWFELGQ